MNSFRKGFALSIVLWIVAVILLGIAYIASLSKDNLELAIMLKDKLNTQIVAKNYLEALKYYILTANYDGQKLINSFDKPKLPTSIIVDGREYIIDNVKISLYDDSSLVRPYNLSLFLPKNNDRELTFTIKDSLLDWMDEDNKARLNGAESTYYSIVNKLGYYPSNINSLQSINELRLIRGIKDINENEWLRKKKEISIKNGRINFMLISKEYLKLLLKLSNEEVEELIKIRESDPIKYHYLILNQQNFNDEYMGFWLSKVIHIKIQVKKNKARSKLNTVIYFNILNTKKPFYIDSYRLY